MREREVSEGEVIDFASKDEDHFYEKKSISVGGRGIQKLVVAFANSDGGEIVIGIKDANEEPNVSKRWDAVDETEEFNFVFQNLLETEPQVPHTPEFLRSQDGTLALRVFIEKSERVHRSSGGTVYVRRGAQSLPLRSHDDIQALAYAKGESSYEDTLVPSAEAEDIFESTEMADFLSSYSPTTDAIDFTINQNLIDRKSYDPRTAGILIFSDNPVPLLPRRCGIKISRYETEAEEPEREHLRDQFTVEGPLYKQIHQSSKIVSDLIESVRIMTPRGLSEAKYPPETIWEVLVNAVIHRDYSISDDIQVLIFNDRVEVISPGRLPGYVTLDNILDARFSRNSKIVRMLNKYEDPPNRDMGEGLNTAFQKMQEFRLQAPRIQETTNSVIVTIAHTSLASPQERVMEFLEHNEIIKNRRAREITGIRSENAMKRVFYDLRDSGDIMPVYSKTGKKIVAWTKAAK